MHACMHACMHVCMYVCTCMYVCMYVTYVRMRIYERINKCNNGIITQSLLSYINDSNSATTFL